MTFTTPESAALAGIPWDAARVLAVRTSADHAYVLLETRPGGPSYPYGVNCHRVAGGWSEGSSGNWAGWSAAGPEQDLGTLAWWDEVPSGADRVRLAHEAEVREEPVEHGYFLSVWWDVAASSNSFPRVIAYRVRGEWLAPAFAR